MPSGHHDGPLSGRVALVAGATRGCGRAIAVELGRAGAHVIATGRSSRAQRSEMDRPETIEDTGDLVRDAGGSCDALVVDHEDPDAVRALVERVGAEHGRLDVLVNDIFGGDRWADWGTKVWEHDLAGGLRMLRMGIDTHLVTTTFAVPLMLRGPGPGLLVEMTDGTREHNQQIRGQVGFYYDFVKGGVDRMVRALAIDLEDTAVTALGVTPGWLRSEAMLEGFGVTEATWREAVERVPGFAIAESPTYVARGVAALAADPRARRFAGEVLTSRDLSDAYGTTDTDGSRPDAWGYIRDHGDAHQTGELAERYR